MQTGAGGFFAFNIMTWVLLGGILMLNTFPAVAAGRYHPVCHDYTVQLHHPSGGNQCEQACIGMVEQFRHYECPYNHAQAEDALRSAALYVCGSCARFIGNACLLHNDIHGTQKKKNVLFRRNRKMLFMLNGESIFFLINKIP